MRLPLLSALLFSYLALASLLALPATAAAQNNPPATSWANQGWDTAASREGLLGGFHWNFESTNPKQAAMHDLILKVRHIAWEFFPLARSSASSSRRSGERRARDATSRS